MTLIDIHTHKQSPDPGTLSIRNLLADFETITVDGYYSVGLHPWYLTTDQSTGLPDSLIRAASAGNVLAIGECGLDTRCPTPADLQRKVFIMQVELALSVGKPLIIHCVRAFDEVLSILRKLRVSVPVIFHGFRQSEMQAKKIIDDGHLLSFGRHLQIESVANVFRSLPVDRVFLETDDAEISVADLYRIAAGIRNVKMECMADDILRHFHHIFGPVTPLI